MSGVDEDDAFLAEAVQQKLVKRITDRFCAVYDRGPGGESRLCSAAGLPILGQRRRGDLREAQDARKVAPNGPSEAPRHRTGSGRFRDAGRQRLTVIVTEVSAWPSSLTLASATCVPPGRQESLRLST